MGVYSVGDRIVHPLHGAGVVVDIEEKQVFGKTQRYYVLNVSTNASRTIKSDNCMKIMIPVDNLEDIGVRDVVSVEEAEKLLKFYSELDGEEELTTNWNKRYKTNTKRLKTGKLDDVALVLKTLTKRESAKPLSSFERKMLSDAKRIMTTELVLALNKDYEEVERLLGIS